MKTYHAKTLEDIARLFDDYAQTESKSAARAVREKHRSILHARVGVWTTAASILRDPELKFLFQPRSRNE